MTPGKENSRLWLSAIILLVIFLGCGEEPTQSIKQNASSLLEQAEFGLPERDELPSTSPPIELGPKEEGSLIFFSNRSDFDMAFPDLPVEDFEEGSVDDGQIAPCSQPLNQFTDNECFSPGDILPGFDIMTNNDHGGNELSLAGPGFYYNSSKNIAVTNYPDALVLDFPNGSVNGIGLDLISYFSEEYFDIEIYGEFGFQAFTQAFAGNGGYFWGVASEVLLYQIIITSPSGQSEAIDNIALNSINGSSGPLEVDIDIKPRHSGNPIKIGAKAMIPVAILSEDGFDATLVDTETVTLGNDDGNDTSIFLRRHGSLRERFVDIDEDGDVDLIVRFSQAQLEYNGDLHSETTELVLNGKLDDGLAFYGSDFITTKPRRP